MSCKRVRAEKNLLTVIYQYCVHLAHQFTQSAMKQNCCFKSLQFTASQHRLSMEIVLLYNSKIICWSFKKIKLIQMKCARKKKIHKFVTLNVALYFYAILFELTYIKYIKKRVLCCGQSQMLISIANAVLLLLSFH